MRLPVDGEQAKLIIERARIGKASIDSIEARMQRMAPPLLYDLTELQRHANRLFGFSAQKTLDIAQALYERYKLISYPRTDSRHLSQDVEDTLPRILQMIEAPHQEWIALRHGSLGEGGRRPFFLAVHGLRAGAHCPDRVGRVGSRSEADGPG
jgi:DNA topoisomerase-3